MKISFLYIESQKEDWSHKAQDLYFEKLKRFCEFEYIRIKSPAIPRQKREHKVQEEAKLILSKIKEHDALILFDETGKSMDSIEFSKQLELAIEANPKRVVFLIGGAFGVAEEIRRKAHKTVSLSKMVMNHHVAMVMALEQIYRAFTIIHGIPYHNE